MYSPIPILHHVVDASEWPSPVKGIAQILGRPLPACLVTEPIPSMSVRALGLFQELTCSPLLRIAEDDSESQPSNSKPLFDVLDIVLSTVSELRDLTQMTDYGCPRPTIPLWFPLIRTLGYAYSEDMSVIGEVPFILPRAASSERNDRTSTDGMATILISYIVDSVDGSQCDSPMSEVNPEPNSAGVHSWDKNNMTKGEDDSDVLSGTDRFIQKASTLPPIDVAQSDEHELVSDNDLSMYSTEEAAPTESTLSSINVPFDAHMLPGHGRRYSAVLPIICVADEEYITSLLSSVLYQRRVWGINEPVVGMVFPKTGTVGQIFLGWLDLESGDDRILPIVHIACAAPGSSAHPPIGIFDLTDPTSALALAQFILGLDSHAFAIKIIASRPSMTTLFWRSDQIEIDSQKTDGPTGERWKGRIAEWARDIYMSDAPSDEPSHPHTPFSSEVLSELSTSIALTMSSETLPPIPEDGNERGRRSTRLKDTEEREDVTNRLVSKGRPIKNAEGHATVSKQPGSKARSKSSSGSKRQSTSVLNVKSATSIGANAEGHEATAKGPTSKPGSRSNSRSKRMSSSELGAKSTVGIGGDDLTISTWMFERNVWTVGHIKLQNDAADSASINSMITTYDEMTKFLWPAEWQDLKAMPRVGGVLQCVQEHLFRQFEEINATQKPSDLELAHVDILSERLLLVLSASLGAYTLKAAGDGRSVYEAEWRHDWDVIFYRFYVVSGEGVSSRVLLERVLSFSRNNAVDIRDPDTLFSEQRSLANSYSTHCMQAETSALKDKLDNKIFKQCHAALTQSIDLMNQILDDPAALAARIKNRAALEPLSGKCDAILVAPISVSGTRRDNPDVAIYLDKCKLVLHTNSSARGIKVPVALESLSPPLSTPMRPISPSPSQHTKPLDPLDPFHVSCNESRAVSALENPGGSFTSAIDWDDLLLPAFIAEYKKADESETKALNQCRMYLVSSVTYLASFGITGYPVFGLVTSGKIGGVIMGWYSKEQDKTYIMERNICTFDLSSPIQAFQFATFLLRVRKQSEKLKALFGEKKAEFVRKARGNELTEWTKEAQTDSQKIPSAAQPGKTSEDAVHV